MKLFLFPVALLVLLCTACEQDNLAPATPAVQISRIITPGQQGLGGYYAVSLDLSKASSHWDLGAQYGIALRQAAPGFGRTYDYYLRDFGINTAGFSLLLDRAGEIKTRIPQEYCDEIDGLASTFCESTVDVIGDGALSPNELWVINIMQDIGRPTACSALGAWGSASEGGISRVIRNLDWYAGQNGSSLAYQAVVTIKGDGRPVTLIGGLGFMGAVTGINDAGLFVGIFDSPIGAVYTAVGKSSYVLDLRRALESCGTKEAAAAYMAVTSRRYAFSHNIIFTDAGGSIVLENDASSTNTRAIRDAGSTLRTGITWGRPDAMAVVNSFQLDASSDNHHASEINTNTARWTSFLTLTGSSGLGPLLSESDMKAIGGWCGSDSIPGPGNEGDIYIRDAAFSGNQQSIYFEPSTMRLEIAFRPLPGTPPLSDTTSDGLPLVPVFVPVAVGF